MVKSMLEIKNLHVEVEGKEILKGVNISVKQGEIHAIMGPNGSGKTSLSFAIMGHPKYKITRGEILYDGKNINSMSPDKRARLGLFLGFQYPMDIPGVSVSNFLRTAYRSLNANGVSTMELRELIKEKMAQLKIDESFAERSLNEGFSGGEKKRMEVLQLAVLQPKIAVLDETDSGTDLDALKVIAKNINEVRKHTGILLVTHYNRILHHVKPDFVHIMIDGKIIKTGNASLADEVEKTGYERLN
jgi:Fe-S cluster assembly ATP-binding protein